MFTNFNADAEGLTCDDIIEKLIERVPEPNVDDYSDQPASNET
jgi:hypothetical protein